jgi:hypothetical protein
MKVAVPQGAEATITEVPWPVIRGTPLERAFCTSTDEKGMFRFPSAPAEAQLNLVVTAQDMATYRTADLPGRVVTRRRRARVNGGFIQGTFGGMAKPARRRPRARVNGEFLEGTTDAPAKI